MKRGMLNLSLYVVALSVSTAGAEVVGNSAQVQAPQRQANLMKPMSITPTQQSGEEVERTDLADEVIIGQGHGNKKEVEDWLKYFDMVVVIDKGTQRLHAFRNQAVKPAVALDEVMTAKVSTGQEAPGCHFTRAAGDVPWVQDVIPMSKHTPTGYYVPTEIDADHFSGTFDGAHMKNAVAWDRKNGFWIHEVPTKNDIGALGSQASHGCIRLSPNNSKALMTMTLMTGPDWNPTDGLLRAHCWHGTDGKSPCTPDADRDRELNSYLTQIKQNNYPIYQEEGKSIDLKSQMPRLSPNSKDQEVLVVNKDGSVAMNGGAPVTKRGGYNTLFIVKDSSIEDLKTGPDGKPLKTADDRYIPKSQDQLKRELLAHDQANPTKRKKLPQAPSLSTCRAQMASVNADLARKYNREIPTDLAAKAQGKDVPAQAQAQNQAQGNIFDNPVGKAIGSFFDGSMFRQNQQQPAGRTR